MRKYIQGQKRASGLFVYDIAIDLRRLFAVSLSRFDPEITEEMQQKLAEAGWIESENAFGTCMVCPKEKRGEMIKALSDALLNWRITSNQARTFSPMETLAVAISDNANHITYAIRADLSVEKEREAVAVLDNDAAQLFVTPACQGYVKDVQGKVDALEEAAAELRSRMSEFDYEHQQVPQKTV